MYVGTGPAPAGDPTAPENSQQFLVDGDQIHLVGGIHSIGAKSCMWGMEEAGYFTADERIWLSCGPGTTPTKGKLWKKLDVRPMDTLIELLPDRIVMEAECAIEFKVGETKVVLTPDAIQLSAASIAAHAEASRLELASNAALEGTAVLVSANEDNALLLQASLARLDGSNVAISGGTTEVTGKTSCAMQGANEDITAAKMVKIGARMVELEALLMSSTALTEHVIKGKPVKIN
jgi:hypothetical protein